MIGLGTLVNVGTVALGSSIGLFIKKGLRESLQDSVIKSLGVATLFIGVTGALSGMFTVADGAIQTQGTMLMIISLALGTVIGELLGIEDGLDRLGVRIRGLKIFKKYQNDSKFVEGFVTASLVTCVGAMTIVGSLQDGLSGDATMLYTKSILDFFSTMIFASTLGIGVLCSAAVILVYQGALTLLATVIAPLLTDGMVNDLGFIGSVLIFALGINLVFGKKIKVGNMLPALLIPIIYGIIKSFIG